MERNMSGAILTLQRADEDTIVYDKILLNKTGLSSWDGERNPIISTLDTTPMIESVVGVSKSTVQRAAPIGYH